MRSQRTPRGVRSEINITPYIDILLVLLIDIAKGVEVEEVGLMKL